MNDQDELTKVFHALADPTRRALLDAIAREGDATVQELAKPFTISLPAVSKHIQVLERAGLVRKSVDAQRRPCHLEAAPLKRATDWMEAYREFWDERLDRLDDYLHQLQAKQRRVEMPPTGDETTIPETNNLTIVREFDAPRELVFKVWFDADHFSKWFGPKGMDVPVCTIEFRVGGTFQVQMTAPNGYSFWTGGEYKEIDPPRRVVHTNYLCTEDGEILDQPHPSWPRVFLSTLVLDELEHGRTRLTLTQDVPADLAAETGATGGWMSAFEKLDDYLQTL